MSQPEERDIERRLRDVSTPPPPADLYERLRQEIPERPRLVRFPEKGSAASTPGRRRRFYLLAASIAVAVIGVSVISRLESPSLPPRRSPARIGESVRPGSPSDGKELRNRGDLPRGVEGRAPGAPPSPAEAPRGDASEAAPSDAQQDRDPMVALERPSAAQLESRQGNEIVPGTPEMPPTDAVRELRVSVSAEAPMPEAGSSADLLPREESKKDVAEKRGRALSRQSSRASELRSLGYVGRPGAARPIVREPGAAVPPSTGGTTEPNDQPYGDMFFESYGVNPFVDTEDDNLSTFGLDVDTGSYTMARSYIEAGHLPPAAAVRVEEFVNYFDYHDPAPRRGDFAVRIEGAPAPFAEGPRYELLRIGIRARDVAAEERPPATLVFVVDVSGSMAREDRLGLVKQSLGLLLDRLRADDRVGLVVYGSQGRVLLEPTGDHEAIRSAIGRLSPGGSTNAEEGLVLAYGLAERFFREEAINRVILCSDGVANVGRTGPDSILARIGAAAEHGIELTTVGFGMGNYNDVLMEQLADRGDGSYAYVDTLPEARRIFVENLTGMLQTVAREAKVQVEFDPASVERYRLLGYENRDIADERFRDDTVDAGEIGAGHTVTALYEIKLAEETRPKDVLATVRLRYHSVAEGKVVETAEVLHRRDLSSSWESAPAGLRLAAVVAELAEILRHSYWAKDGDLGALFAEAQRLSAAHPGDLEVAQLATLIGRAAQLQGPVDSE